MAALAIASASTTTLSRTRVRGINLAGHSRIGGERHVARRARWGSRIAERQVASESRFWLRPDPLVLSGPDADEAQARQLNLFAYVGNNPVQNVDRNGGWFDTVFDVASIGLDINAIREWDDQTSFGTKAVDVGSLAFDVGALVLPFLPAVAGVIMKGAKAGEKTAEGVKAAEKGVEAVEGAAKAPGAGRGGNKLAPASDAAGRHSTFKRNAKGEVTGHAEWAPNSRNPKGFDLTTRTDTQYANPHTHRNKVTGEPVPTPHTHDPKAPGEVRTADLKDLPK